MPDFIFRDIYSITPDFIAENKVKGLILDIDNTLVTYDDPKPTERVSEWLDSMQKAGVKLAFISNNGMERVTKFNEELGFFASWKSKKPFPFMLKKAMRAMGTDKASTLAVGDQIFTDVTAGKLAGVRTVLVEPIKDLTTRFNLFKRRMEKIVLSGVKR